MTKNSHAPKKAHDIDPSADLSHLEAALAYIRAGWFVIPLDGKVPLTPSGKNDASQDEATIRSWWSRWPDANIGGVMGKPLPGGGFGVTTDVDPRNGGWATFDALEANGNTFPSTREHDTGGKYEGTYGKHLIYRTSKPLSDGKLGQGIDVKGSGYIVLPPSVHPETGDAYEIAADVPLENLAELPAWISVFIARPKEEGFAPEPIDVESEEGKRRVALGEKACREFPESRADGEGGKRLFSLCLRLVRALELPLEVAHALISEHFNPRCTDPQGAPYPWSDEEITHKLEDARDRSDMRTGVLSGKTEEGLEALKESRKPENRQKKTIADLAARVQAEKTLSEVLTEQEQWAWDLKVGDGPELTRTLLEFLGQSQSFVFTEGSFFEYDPKQGIWDASKARDALRALLWSMSGTDMNGRALKITASLEAHALDILATKLRADDFFKSAVAGIACPNGFLQVTSEGATLVPHAKEHRARTRSDIPYESGLRCERWEKFLDDLVRDDEDKAKKIDFLAEFFGACRFGIATRFQRGVILSGEGENGKGTLMRCTTPMFPKGSITNTQPRKMQTTFGLSDLPGRLLNYVDELESEYVKETSALKTAIAGEQLQAEAKGKDQYSFEPIAGHIFNANELPPVRDRSKGFWRRWAIITFNRKFKAEEKVLGLADMLLETSRGAIFAWMVEGVVRLLARGDYELPESHFEALRGWRDESDITFTEWFEKSGRWEKTETAATGMRELYLDYRGYTEDAGQHPLSEPKFSARMKEQGFERDTTDAKKLVPMRLLHGRSLVGNERRAKEAAEAQEAVRNPFRATVKRPGGPKREGHQPD